MNVAVGRAETAQGDEQKRPPWERTIPEVKDVIVGELAERGEWIVANIDATSSWPLNSQKVTYRGDVFWIMPIMRGYFPAVAMKIPARLNRAQEEDHGSYEPRSVREADDAVCQHAGLGRGRGLHGRGDRRRKPTSADGTGQRARLLDLRRVRLVVLSRA